MPQLKTVHLGAIQLGPETICTLVGPNRHKLIAALNDWLFDYQYANRMDIKQLPPLDDWTHSTEDITFWSIQFPNAEWTVSVRADFIEFEK